MSTGIQGESPSRRKPGWGSCRTPPMFVGVDLAWKWSALVGLDLIGDVEMEADSSDSDIIIAICSLVANPLNTVLLEDVPPNLRLDIAAKEVLRMQGQIIERCRVSCPDILLDASNWIYPMQWMSKMGYKGKKVHGSTSAWAKERCKELGYAPPDHARGSKLLQDYRDSYLIAEYARRLILDVPLSD